MALDSCTTKITQYLSDSDALQLQDVVECLSDINSFTGLESTYQQSQYYTKHFHLLVINYYNIIVDLWCIIILKLNLFFTKNPTEHVLGESECVANGRTVRKRDHCYDIPLLDSLQCQLRSDTIRDQVCRPFLPSYSGRRIK